LKKTRFLLFLNASLLHGLKEDDCFFGNLSWCKRNNRLLRPTTAGMIYFL
jgi:hypothetical protein